MAQATFRTTAGGDGDGLSASVWFIVIALLALAFVSLGLFGYRQRTKRRSALAGGPGAAGQPAVRTAPPQVSEHAPAGKLDVVAGPNVGVSVRVGTSPLDLGTDPSCGLRLNVSGEDVAARHARAWLQGDRLLLHHLARGHATLVGSTSVEWATLESEDTLQIGPHIIAFVLDS